MRTATSETPSTPKQIRAQLKKATAKTPGKLPAAGKKAVWKKKP